MHTSESQWNPDEILDTKRLQIFALKEFMYALGYHYIVYSTWTHRFESNKFSNKGRKVLSFKKAVDLYNNNTAKCVFGRPPSKLSIWSFDDYTIAKAKASRVLKGIKLQFCKQTNQVVCQDHRVQFTIESYSRLFLNNKYLGV